MAERIRADGDCIYEGVTPPYPFTIKVFRISPAQYMFEVGALERPRYESDGVIYDTKAIAEKQAWGYWEATRGDV